LWKNGYRGRNTQFENSSKCNKYLFKPFKWRDASAKKFKVINVDVHCSWVNNIIYVEKLAQGEKTFVKL
jgi:hypothetical protein